MGSESMIITESIAERLSSWIMAESERKTMSTRIESLVAEHSIRYC